MIIREWWRERLERAWKQRSIVWLSGVRRVGKTLLCRSLPETEYFDCELPRTRRLLDAPEEFLEQHRGRRLVLDEIHRLATTFELLKISAGHTIPTGVDSATGRLTDTPSH